MTKLPSPKLIWLEDGTPFSERFGDVYFGSGAISEIQHVFLDGIGIPQILMEGRTFTLIETGFGTGLNFLAVWKLWRERVGPGSRLNYISVEGYPLARKDISRAHAPYPSYASLSKELCNNLPPLIAGYHEVSFDNGGVNLLLLYGQVQEMLPCLVATADAWFLDGFAPARNPAMWASEVLEIVGQLSNPGTRFATFTAAGEVRRGLEAVGFYINKRPGYGRKRECLTGFMEQKKSVPQSAPWFALPKPINDGRKVAIIGAGIAGCCLARGLSKKGLDVKIYEAEKEPGMGASGTPSAILQPRPFFNEDTTSWFHAAAYLKAVNFYDDLEKDGNPIWQSRGLLAIGRDSADGKRYKDFARSGTLPCGQVEWVDTSTASKKIGLALSVGGAWFPSSGSLNTKIVCSALIKGLDFESDARVSKIFRKDNLWLLIDHKGRTLGKAPNVVIAAGYRSEILSSFGNFGLVANRGQLTLLDPPHSFRGQKASLSYGGYLTPPILGDGGKFSHVMGASFERINNPEANKWLVTRNMDNEANTRILAQRLPGLETNLGQCLGGWVGLRATTSDRFPVMGGVPDRPYFVKNYANLRYGGKAGKFPAACYNQGMYVLTGFGSQGFLMAPLVSDLLAAVITGTAIPQPRAILDAMHPARFMIKNLKRGVV